MGIKGAVVFGAVRSADEATPSGRQTVEGDSSLLVEGSSTIDVLTLSDCIELSFARLHSTAEIGGFIGAIVIVNQKRLLDIFQSYNVKGIVLSALIMGFHNWQIISF
jgi:hypothetical protein